MAILVTGGAGFIGSHTAVEFLNAGYEIIVVDNYCNSSPKSIERVKEITGKDFKFYEIDLRDRAVMEDMFAKENISAVIHFAGHKAVGESVAKPLAYYDNNLISNGHEIDLLCAVDGVLEEAVEALLTHCENGIYALGEGELIVGLDAGSCRNDGS